MNKVSISTSLDEMYQLVVEDALAGYWDWNLSANKFSLSSASKRVLGYQENEIENLAENWGEIFFEEDLSSLKGSIKRYLKSGSDDPHRIEIRFRHKSGEVMWAMSMGRVIERNEEGYPLRMVGYHVDISSQKAIEQELKISETRFKGAFEYSAIGMALVSTEGRWLKVNRKVCQLLGYSERELLKTTFQDVTHPEDLELDLSHLHEMLANKRDTYEIEKRYFHKNGEIIWVQLNVSLVKDAQGNPIHFVSQIQDITRRKKAQQELEALTEKLTNRNQKLGDFAHITSHNLRSPVSNLSSLMYMYDQLDDESDRSELISKFQMVVNHLSSTLNDLVDALKIQEDLDQVREEIELSSVLQKTKELLIGQFSSLDIDLITDFSAGDLVNYHRPYLESIFLNLMTNAIKYRSTERQLKIEISSKVKEEGFFLHFKDNGLGIDLDRHGHKIFGLHKTFHRHKEAKGVGLFMTKTQVEAMGGKISVKSKPGEGAEFIISL